MENLRVLLQSSQMLEQSSRPLYRCLFVHFISTMMNVLSVNSSCGNKTQLTPSWTPIVWEVGRLRINTHKVRLCAQLLGLSHNNDFLKKIKKRLVCRSKVCSQLAVWVCCCRGRVCFISFNQTLMRCFPGSFSPPQRTMGPLYLNDICWCHSFREATAVPRSLWYKNSSAVMF